LTGTVVDTRGKPAANVEVSYSWTANGTQHAPDGTAYNLDTVQGQRAFWGHVGQMEPRRRHSATTGSDGRFALDVDNRFCVILALDSARQRGAVAILPNGFSSKGHGSNGHGSSEHSPANLEIKLTPLVRVSGTVLGPKKGVKPVWTYVDVSIPYDATRPLAVTRLVGCGSFDANFSVLLPPGRYVFEAHSADGDRIDGRTEREREITVTSLTTGTTGPRELPVGALQLSVTKPTLPEKIEQAKAAGTWRDYTKHYGEQLPPWHIVDARGARKTATLADFRGKWLLVEFWGLDCTACLRKGLPHLMKFYDAHQRQRDRFEIIAFCIDFDGELKTIEQLDQKLKPIVDHAWDRPLPFPILLDPTFTTLERLGLTGLGTVFLIDPQGNLQKGRRKRSRSRPRGRCASLRNRKGRAGRTTGGC
jgi:hypothetical protein